uniref:MARVEL domain-containing protein n=1 Tax=Ascaris lumbricoides TaxID=6252 RepID=A0A9J2P0Y3_ASCLU
MADPLHCLRGAAITIAVWNIIYSLVQMAIFGWQTRFVRDLQWSFQNRPLPPFAFNPYQPYFPGVYSIYSESPQQRRINALFALALASLVFSFIHLCLTSVLLIGSGMQKPNAVWPWFFSAVPLIALSTAYAVLWWSGDVFGEQLTMSVAEFVMSLAVNSICVIVVAFYYFRLRGYLTSVHPKTARTYDDDSRESTPEIPEWRQKRDEQPPRALERNLRHEHPMIEVGFKGMPNGRHNIVQRSRRDEQRNHEQRLHGPYVSRETLRRASQRRRPHSEPRASMRRPPQNTVQRDRGPVRGIPSRQTGLTAGRLKAHDSAMERLHRPNIGDLARRPKHERNSAV